MNESVIWNLYPYLRCLRPDERLYVTHQFQTMSLAKGASAKFPAAEPVLLVVLDGQFVLDLNSGEQVDLYAGDSFGELNVISGRSRDLTVTASADSTLAVLNQSKLEEIFERIPILAQPFVVELGHDLKWRNDLLREVCLAHSSGLSPERINAIFRRRRRRLLHHRSHSLRRVGQALFRVIIAEPSRRASFWMFLGASLALISARTMVGMILDRGLEGQLFALIGDESGNAIHIHHFNYGLLLVSLTGLLSMLPRTRPWIRTLSFLFGFGVGLIVDEFALLWNLNPDYYQPSSRLAAAVVLFFLVQVVYFRSIYSSLGRRLWAWVLAR